MAEQAVRQRIVVPFSGHVIGQGFNSDTAERVGTALDVGQVGEDAQAAGQTAVFKFQMLTSQSSLEKALDIGVEVDARYALFSGGAKFDFAESSALNVTSTYILASCMVSNALRFGSDFTPNDRAEPLIAAADTDNFRKAFGDRFTEALHTGGEFFALVRITSSDSKHQRNIAASLHGEYNGLVTAVSFKAAMTAATSDTSSHTEVVVEVHQSAGVGAQVQIPGIEADKVRDHMNRFAAAVHENPVAYRAELVTYDTLSLPFPSPVELEDKRQVLEDCLQRRQRYWSAISELTFAQSEDAALIFQDVPPVEELIALQSAFRQVLNELMAHARAVSRGSIPPTLFLPAQEPIMPRLKRRTTGSFQTWWTRAKQNDPTLLRDERLLIEDIGRAVDGSFVTSLAEAPAEVVERAADMLKALHLNSGSDHLEFPRVTSLAALPTMIDAPLESLTANGIGIEDLAGIEKFSRLQRVQFFDGRVLSDLGALAAVAGIEELDLGKNAIRDIGPLRALTSLRDLRIGRNLIEDLSPLQGLKALETLDIASNRITSLDPLAELPALRTLSIEASSVGDIAFNPIANARALGRAPRLSCALTSLDKVRMAVVDVDGVTTMTGLAARIRDGNTFEFTPDAGGDAVRLVIQGVFEWTAPALFTEPVVATAVRFPSGLVGIACSRPEDRLGSMRAAEMLTLVPDEIPFGTSFEGMVFLTPASFDRLAPQLFLEIEPI